jgi:hypothetical protein
MTWNFRIIRTPVGVAVHHVYCNEAGDMISCGATPYVAESYTIEELRNQLELILFDAFEKPVIDGSFFDLPGE